MKAPNARTAGVLLALAALAAFPGVAAARPSGRLAAPPVHGAVPTIAGSAQLGQTLTTTSGSWSGANPLTFAYQWLRCDGAGQNCPAIAGATSPTYTLAANDVGLTIRVTVTASNPDGSDQVTSSPTGVIVRPVGQVVPTAAPTITGAAQVGQRLTATPGLWSGAPPITYSYVWQRCDASGGGCAAIAGATAQTYVVASGDLGRTLRVLVTAANSSGSGSAISAATGAVAAVTPPTNTVLPTISGTAQRGKTLSASEGSWNGPPSTFTYQWVLCDAGGGSCAAISGATGKTYALTVGDVSHTLRIAVTAANAAGSGLAYSNPSAVVAPSVPTNTSLPTILPAGGPIVAGQTLTATAGAWISALPLTFHHQWARCGTQGENCVPIAEAKQPTYMVRAAEVGHTLIVQVKATNTIGSSFANSQESGVTHGGVVRPGATPQPPAAPGQPTGQPAGATRLATGQYSIPVSSVSRPERLLISGIQASPSTVRSRTEPILARFRVTDTRNYAVRGALVYVLGLPYGRIAPVPEQATDESGYATLQLNPTAKLPLVNGGALVLFVRARKPGDDLLAGVSTRRLVQLRVGAG